MDSTCAHRWQLLLSPRKDGHSFFVACAFDHIPRVESRADLAQTRKMAPVQPCARETHNTRANEWRQASVALARLESQPWNKSRTPQTKIAPIGRWPGLARTQRQWPCSALRCQHAGWHPGWPAEHCQTSWPQRACFAATRTPVAPTGRKCSHLQTLSLSERSAKTHWPMATLDNDLPSCG